MRSMKRHSATSSHACFLRTGFGCLRGEEFTLPGSFISCWGVEEPQKASDLVRFASPSPCPCGSVSPEVDCISGLPPCAMQLERAPKRAVHYKPRPGAESNLLGGWKKASPSLLCILKPVGPPLLPPRPSEEIAFVVAWKGRAINGLSLMIFTWLVICIPCRSASYPVRHGTRSCCVGAIQDYLLGHVRRAAPGGWLLSVFTFPCELSIHCSTRGWGVGNLSGLTLCGQ